MGLGLDEAGAGLLEFVVGRWWLVGMVKWRFDLIRFVLDLLWFAGFVGSIHLAKI